MDITEKECLLTKIDIIVEIHNEKRKTMHNGIMKRKVGYKESCNNC